MNRGRVVAYLLQQQREAHSQPACCPVVLAESETVQTLHIRPSLARKVSRLIVAGAVSTLVLLVGWGCATMPANRPPDDPFANNPPMNPQNRARPMSPPLWGPVPNNVPQYRAAPPANTPRPATPTPAQPTPTPKTFSDSPNWPAVPPTQRQQIPIDVDPLPESRDADKPADAPTLFPPSTGPQASRTSFLDLRQNGKEQLVLTVESPQRRPVGSGAPFQLTVKNPSGNRVRDVQIVCEFDDALKFPGSTSQSVTHRIPRIDPGDARSSLLTLVGQTPGRHNCRFSVSVGSQAVVRKTATVEFIDRQLDWHIQGPTERSVGSRAEFNIPLVNVSEQDLQNLRVQINLDAALTVREMTRGGELSDRRVTWNIDRLAAKEGLLLQLEVECREATTQACLAASVSGTGLPQDDTEACLTVKPIVGSLDVQLQDVSDPVSVGDTAEFIVSVSNRGLQPVSGVVLNCTWPDSFEFVRVEAREGNRTVKVTADVKGHTATFSPAPVLHTDKSLEYRLKLKAGRVGAHQITVSATAGAEQAPVEVSEPIMVHR